MLNKLRKEDSINNNKDFERFRNISMKVLNKYTLRKKMLEAMKYLYDERFFQGNNEKAKTAS